MKKVVYIPGLGKEQLDISVKSYALRMMKAFDENDPKIGKKYRIESTEIEYDSDGSLSTVISMFENDNGNESEIYRFYEFKYGKFLTSRYVESNVLFKFTSLLFVLISRLLSVIASIFIVKDQVSKKVKVQALYFAIIYIIFAVYLVSLIPTLLALLISFAGYFEALKEWVAPIKNYQSELAAIIASFSAFMLFSPNSKNIFSDTAVEYLAANQYLSVGAQRLLMMGKLTRLIETMAEANEQAEIEIHSYSFGSVLAIDVMFPYESVANTRIQKSVTKLITIGCPFDFIDTYWRNYFSDRKVSNMALTSWHNVNSDLDVLSTKFTDNKTKQMKFIASEAFWKTFNNIDLTYNMVNPKQVSLVQMFLFYGLKAHQMYWDQHVDSKSCLFNLVKRDTNIENPNI